MEKLTFIHTLVQNVFLQKCAIGVVLTENEGLPFLLYERSTDAGTVEYISSVTITEFEEADRLFCKRVGRTAGKGYMPIYQPKISSIAFGEYLFDNEIGESFPYHSFKPIIREYERLLGLERATTEMRPLYEQLDGFGAF